MISRGKKITSVVNGGVKNQLPTGTLCFHDRMLSQQDFMYRAAFIADRIGQAKLVSRIATDLDRLKVTGASTLVEWWDRASSYQRWVLLTTRGKVGRAPEGFSYENIPGDLSRALHGMTNAPFRDAGLIMGKEATDEEEDLTGYSTSSGEDSGAAF
jgi:hypothetical protein